MKRVVVTGMGIVSSLGNNTQEVLASLKALKNFLGEKTIESLEKGEILEIISDCPQSINNIPIDAKNHGYKVLSIDSSGPTIQYLIQK